MAELEILEEVEEEEIDYSRLDRLMKQKLGHVRGLLDWIPDAEKQRSLFPFGIAAAVFLVLGLGTLLWMRPRPGIITTSPRPILATLHWGLGTEATDSMTLGNMKQDTPYRAGAMQIARMGNEFFVRVRQGGEAAQGDTILYHFAVNGNENIQIFFEDATRMQLARNSNLTFHDYPPGTLQKERELECDGEVLVNVNPDYVIPTVIKTRRARIAVIGTFFKFRDYKTEDTSAVFCYNGKISVTDPTATAQILGPGQRATVLPGRGIILSSNDFPMAKWSSKELVFDFSNDNLEDAMREIARWYGVPEVKFDVSIDKKTRGMVYIGPLSRYLTLQQLLSVLERKGVHFSIQGKEILVSP